MFVTEKRVFASSLDLKTCTSIATAATVSSHRAATPAKNYKFRGFLRSSLGLPILYRISVSL